MLRPTSAHNLHPTAVAIVAAVKAMPPAAIDVFLDELAGLQAVADAGWRVRRRRVGVERYPQRNAEIRQRNTEGQSCGQLALDYGLTRSAISKIVRAGRKKCVHSTNGHTLPEGRMKI
jgi:hypothetical protein